jgi:hypothetical protein
LFWLGFGQRLSGSGGLGQENCEGEAALREVGHEEVRPQGDVQLQPVQDQDPGRKGEGNLYRGISSI